MDTHRDKFIRLAQNRTRKAIKDIRLIGNLSNRNSYSYSDDDIECIFSTLETELKTARNRYHESGNGQGIEFSLI